MDLFAKFVDPAENLLPVDGIVNYHGPVLSPEQADWYFEQMMHTIAWRHDEAIIYGRHITTKRRVAWYGDRAWQYTYSRTTKSALPWIEPLHALKRIVETHSSERYNSCLLNLYHSGEEGMSWHSDGETDLVRNGAIGSLSLGAARRFSFRHNKLDQRVDVTLDHGSLLVMKGVTQSHWKHRLPPTKKVLQPRINLTFRQIRDQVSPDQKA
jgi:alkylated DNA repair dioxygenase AlkB